MEEKEDVFSLKRINDRKKEKLTKQDLVYLEQIKNRPSFKDMITLQKPSWIEEGLSDIYQKQLEEDMALGILQREKVK